MALTPIERFTQQFMDVIEHEAQLSDNEVKRRLEDAFKVLVALYLVGPKSAGYNFRFPKSADQIFSQLRLNLREIFEKRTENAVSISKAKNTQILNTFLHTPDLTGWLDRTVGEKTLNQRILKITNAFKMEVEGRIARGIVNGEKEAAIIRDVEKFLLDPYAFLKVDVKSDYAARRLAIKYAPKTGTYKSAYANAKRLVRSEVFEAYRRADHLIWKASDQVVGVLVYLSPLHPFPDMCDDLKGRYPKGFFFPGWHPNCICLSRPIIRGEVIKGVPTRAMEYMSQEKKQKYYGKLSFINQNKKYWK